MEREIPGGVGVGAGGGVEELYLLSYTVTTCILH